MERLHFVFILREIFSPYLADVTHSYWLPADVAHLDRKLKGILKVINTIFTISKTVVADTQVDICKELPINICQIFMKSMIFYGFLCKTRISLA